MIEESNDGCVITVASYGRLPDAVHDWERLEALGASEELNFVDAMLVEGDRHIVSKIHRLPSHGTARAEAASAVLALLQPAVMVSGAVAGGVGETMLLLISRSIDRDEVRRLGSALDGARFSIVAMLGPPDAKAEQPPIDPWDLAGVVASANSSCTPDDVFWAALTDSADT